MPLQSTHRRTVSTHHTTTRHTTTRHTTPTHKPTAHTSGWSAHKKPAHVSVTTFDGSRVDLGVPPKANGPIATDMKAAFAAGQSHLATKEDRLQALVDKYEGNRPAQRAVRDAFSKGEALMD